MEAGDYLIRLGSDFKNTAVAALFLPRCDSKTASGSNQLQADHEMDVLTTPQACIERTKGNGRSKEHQGRAKLENDPTIK